MTQDGFISPMGDYIPPTPQDIILNNALISGAISLAASLIFLTCYLLLEGFKHKVLLKTAHALLIAGWLASAVVALSIVVMFTLPTVKLEDGAHWLIALGAISVGATLIKQVKDNLRSRWFAEKFGQKSLRWVVINIVALLLICLGGILLLL